MKLKLFSGKLDTTTLEVTGGGYDAELGRVVLVVRGDNGVVGTVEISPPEAAKVSVLLATSPKVERVEATTKP